MFFEYRLYNNKQVNKKGQQTKQKSYGFNSLLLRLNSFFRKQQPKLVCWPFLLTCLLYKNDNLSYIFICTLSFLDAPVLFFSLFPGMFREHVLCSLNPFRVSPR